MALFFPVGRGRVKGLGWPSEYTRAYSAPWLGKAAFEALRRMPLN